MFNTDDRRADKPAYHMHGAYQDSTGRRLDPKLDATSYGNEYTNVAWLKTYLDTEAKDGYIHLVPIYIEGIGTLDHEADNSQGYRYGTGPTGIWGKVNKGIAKLEQSLSKNISARYRTKIKELRLDVFGFSRGAAAARYFIARMLRDTAKDFFGTYPKFIDILRHQQYDIDKITVGFAGLFDTVSTYGIYDTVRGRGNVEELSLDAVADAAAVFHIAAADEHRQNFALTDITSAVESGTGKELFLPGVHCDIGGSYQDHMQEQLQLIDTDYPATHGNVKYIEHDINSLITLGWFRRSDIINADTGGFLTEDRAQSPFRQAINNNGESGYTPAWQR